MNDDRFDLNNGFGREDTANRPVDRTRGRSVDRTGGNPVDRTQRRSVDRTSGGGVDRTGGKAVDRTSRGSVDRTEGNGIDRTRGGVDRTAGKSVDRVSDNENRSISSADYDFGRFESTQNNSGSTQGDYSFENFAPRTERRTAERSAVRPSGRSESRGMSQAGGKSSAKHSRSTHKEKTDVSHSAHNKKKEKPSLIYKLLARIFKNDEPSELMHREAKIKKGLRTTGRSLVAIMLILVIAGCLMVASFGVYVFGFVDDSIDFNLNNLKLDCSSTIYVKNADDGWEEYQKLYYEDREWVPITEVSQNAVNAFVAGEDERFYKHNGIDWKRTLGAFVNMFVDIYGSTQGGSTITQQLVKNLTGDRDQSPMRKIREIMRARRIESEYSKETIMECYMNVVYLNNNKYGIEAASQYYFGKSARELSVTEAASIAAITKDPWFYDPTNNMKPHRDRRNWIISKMYELEMISEKQYKDGIASEVKLGGRAAEVLNKTDKEEETSTPSNVYSYFTDAVIDQLIDDFMEKKGYTETYATNMIYSGGLKIYATLDLDCQSAVDKVFEDEDNFSSVYGTKQKAQAAITVMDYSGHVAAIYGGRGEKTVNRGLNRAVHSERQPGSAMKPIGVYAPALEENLITYSTKVENSALRVNGVNLTNYDHSTSGPVTVQNALERSLNLVPARIVQKLTPKRAFEYVTGRFGITSVVDSVVIDGKEFSDIDVSPMALGGLTYGVTTYELTAAYCTFGNGGLYYKPTTYTKVTDYKGVETILEYKFEPVRAISEDTAYIMNRLLSTVVTGSSGTGRGAAFGGWDVIAKTGTTTDHKDRWFVGGTPRYMAAVWFGCDTPFSMTNLSSSTNPALRLWKPAMEKIHKNLEKKSFEKCDSVKHVKYCLDSGMIAKSGCKKTADGYFKADYMPQCTQHGGKVSNTSSGNPTGSGVSSTASGGESSVNTSSETVTSGDTSSAETSSSTETSSAAETSAPPPSSSQTEQDD